MTQPKLLSIPKAAEVIGEDIDTVREWTRRPNDPLPTIVTGSGHTREHRKVVMAMVDEWIERNTRKGGSQCA